MEPVNFVLILTLQLVLIVYDFGINAAIMSLYLQNVVELVLFIVQDICIVFQIIVLFLEIFNTSTFQNGFVKRVFGRFRLTLLILVIYLLISVSHHAWTLTLRWTAPRAYLWSIGGYYALYVIHRFWAVLYYYYYKRTALKLADPDFYLNLHAGILRNQLLVNNNSRFG